MIVNKVAVSGGGDNALALKSKFSLGKKLKSYDIHVSNSYIASNDCNALQIGSETVGDFEDVGFENITIMDGTLQVIRPSTHLT